MMAAMLITAAVTLVVGLPVLLLLRGWNVEQRISEFVPEHLSKQGTPTAGGLMMLVASVMMAVLASTVQWPVGRLDHTEWIWLLLGFSIIGILDDVLLPRLTDKRGLGWIPKLILQFAVAVPVCAFTYLRLETASSGGPFLGQGAGAVALASIIVVGMANAVNFADGMDGLAAGLVVLVAIGMFMGSGDPLMCGILAGTSLGFLAYNAPPAKVFMGDTGSLMLGAGLGYVLVTQHQGSPWLVLLLAVLIVELVPVPMQILWVKLRGKRLFVRTPIHHAFQHMGVPEQRVVAGFLLLQTVCTIAYGVLVT